MRGTGIWVKMDDQGRVKIPLQIRKKQMLKPGDELEVLTCGATVCLRKVNAYALFEDVILQLRDIVTNDIRMSIPKRKEIVEYLDAASRRLKEGK